MKNILLITTAVVALSACSGKEPNRQVDNGKPDREMQAVLDAHASLHPKPIEKLTAVEARKQPSPADAAKLVMQQKGMDPNDPMGVETQDIVINGSIPARAYRPADTQPGEVLPVVLYFHGGGWVLANLDTYDATPRAMAKQARAIVISSHYRQAPENKFPAAHNDAYTAYQWTLQNAERLGGDVNRIAIMGESAGGNLALATAIKARDNGIPMPLRIAAIYPVAGVDMNTPSYQEHAKAKPLNKAMMGWFVKNVIKKESDKKDARLDLIGQAHLAGLPPVTLITASIDPLRSDGEMLATRLRNAGVQVHSENYVGVTHEFFGMGGVLTQAQKAEAAVAQDLRNSFVK